MSSQQIPDPAPPKTAWHALSAEKVLSRLESNAERGLTEAEAQARLRRYGPNQIQEGKRRSYLSVLLGQFTDFMILLLIAASIVSGAIGDIEDTVMILMIVLLSGIAGSIQEWRATTAISALRRLAAPQAVALRGGHARTLPASGLVPGDIVLLEAGQSVPADIRLLTASELRANEATLTGESMGAEKQTAPALPDAPLPDRHDMVYKGTTILHGHGRGIVVATGMETEIGRIASMLTYAEGTQTPLQRRLAKFGRQIATLAIGICLLFFAVGLWRGEAPVQMLLTAISLAVAAIPEALPAVVTALLALGAARMARQNALVRRLPAVETLGSVTTICTDKTGTLTLNDMSLTRIWIPGMEQPMEDLDIDDPARAALLEVAALCTDLAWDENGTPLGDPTEVALWRAAQAAGLGPRMAGLRRQMEIQFDSVRKRMTVLYHDAGHSLVCSKGAPETILPLCATMASPSGPVALGPNEISAAAARMAEAGLRVLAVARATIPQPPRTPEEMEAKLEFLGLVGLADPPRPEAAPAVALCRRAGIRPVMITGDHPVTASAIARAVGILGMGGQVITGTELAALDDPALRRRVKEVSVFARVDPEQKIRIVAALRANGENVAMTGDGVNDAPALALADIGIAMGRGGTDVARQAASLVLLDDNFATIVTAVREGRRIYDNIRKFVCFVVACNSAEIGAIFLAPLLGMPVPLLPVQILWVNLVTDGLPGFALAAEPAEPDVMARPPRPPREGLLTGELMREIAWSGVIMTGITLLTEFVAIRNHNSHWQTMVFTVLTIIQMWQALSVRSLRLSLFQCGLLANKPLLGAIGLTILLQLAVIYFPPFTRVFHTSPLSLAELGICFIASSLIFIASELAKATRRRSMRREARPAA